MQQLRGEDVTIDLPLEGGFHVGPLFVANLQRPLARPHGKQGKVHRAQTLRATPKWADKKAIAAFYAEARYLTQKTGELYVVDHIVPKISKTVCGLHVPCNLRVVHWLENAQKGSLWWPNMWHEQIDLFTKEW